MFSKNVQILVSWGYVGFHSNQHLRESCIEFSFIVINDTLKNGSAESIHRLNIESLRV